MAHLKQRTCILIIGIQSYLASTVEERARILGIHRRVEKRWGRTWSCAEDGADEMRMGCERMVGESCVGNEEGKLMNAAREGMEGYVRYEGT